MTKRKAFTGFDCPHCRQRAPDLAGSRIVKGVRYCSTPCAEGTAPVGPPPAPPAPTAEVQRCPGFAFDRRFHVPDEPVVGGFKSAGIGIDIRTGQPWGDK